MSLIRYLLQQSWQLLSGATFAGLISGFCGAALAALISKGINEQQPGTYLAIAFFGVCLLFLLSKSISEITLLHLTQRAVFQMRVDLSRKLLAAPYKRLQKLGKPGLLAIFTKDVDTFIQAFQLIPLAFGNAVVIVVCLGYMAWLSWQIFLVFTFFLCTGAALYHMAEKYPLKHLTRVREQMDLLYKHFRNLIEGSKELQMNQRRGAMFVDAVITPDARKFMQLFIHSMTTYTCVANFGLMLFYVVLGLLLFVLPRWLPTSNAVITSVTLILLYLIRPISELMYALPGLRQAGIALSKIQQLNGEFDEIAMRPAGSGYFASQQPLTLQLKNVCHQYPGPTDDSSFMLGPLNLTIGQGEVVFIVGGNGSGKTTLAMLMLGLYEPESGVILLNNKPVTTENLNEYRQHFSVVFADFHLFEELLDDAKGDIGRAEYYIKLLAMDHRVKVENGKFSTTELSSGQRKRLALISSYLEDHQIYLFDEWASDQDPVFKRVFYTELLPELKSRGKTVLVISHDDTYFSQADRIIEIENGNIRDSRLKIRPVEVHV
jgi:putative ATP-binding cassette transporter